jgi:hypothetical protein
MMVRRQVRTVAVALAMVLGLVGCGSDSDEKSADEGSSEETTETTTGETARTVPAGYIDVKDSETGVSVAVPQDWQQVPLNAATLRQQADAVRERNPKLAETLDSAQGLIGGGGKLFAIHPEGESNVNLIVTDSGGATLEDIPGPAVRELRSRGATIQSQERTSLNGEDAVKVTMKFPVTPEETVDEVQYYVIKRGRAYILTLTGHDPALDVIAKSMAIS